MSDILLSLNERVVWKDPLERGGSVALQGEEAPTKVENRDSQFFSPTQFGSEEEYTGCTFRFSSKLTYTF